MQIYDEFHVFILPHSRTFCATRWPDKPAKPGPDRRFIPLCFHYFSVYKLDSNQRVGPLGRHQDA